MDFLETLGIRAENFGASTGSTWLADHSGEALTVVSPVDGKTVATVFQTSAAAYEEVVLNAGKAFTHWREVPAPKRGEIVRQIGLRMRQSKQALGRLISYEMGKSLQEGLGEVQEMIDICDLAVGQSRMLYGSTIASDRARHRWRSGPGTR
jgi:aldehyde dehydrogenase (NAD+)